MKKTSPLPLHGSYRKLLSYRKAEVNYDLIWFFVSDSCRVVTVRSTK